MQLIRQALSAIWCRKANGIIGGSSSSQNSRTRGDGLERRLREAWSKRTEATNASTFSPASQAERREEVKRAFNSDPAKEPLRILICTDAAREGVNLQSYCADLIHFDLPWNPARLEQRMDASTANFNRKAHHVPIFRTRSAKPTSSSSAGAQDRTDKRRARLCGPGHRGTRRQALGRGRHRDRNAEQLAREIEAEDDVERLARARAEMDDEERVRFGRVQREREELAKALEDLRERVGVDALDLHNVVATALKRADYDLDKAKSDRSARFRRTSSTRRGRVCAGGGLGRRVRRSADPAAQTRRAHRRMAPERSDSKIALSLRFCRMAETPRHSQVHLEHRLVRRLLSRFLSKDFNRVFPRRRSFTGRARIPA